MGVLFVQVGNHFLNLELVASIELVPDIKNGTKAVAARVHYSTGKTQDFSDPVEIQGLAAWLHAHKAP